MPYNKCLQVTQKQCTKLIHLREHCSETQMKPKSIAQIQFLGGLRPRIRARKKKRRGRPNQCVALSISMQRIERDQLIPGAQRPRSFKKPPKKCTQEKKSQEPPRRPRDRARVSHAGRAPSRLESPPPPLPFDPSSLLPSRRAPGAPRRARCWRNAAKRHARRHPARVAATSAAADVALCVRMKNIASTNPHSAFRFALSLSLSPAWRGSNKKHATPPECLNPHRLHMGG